MASISRQQRKENQRKIEKKMKSEEGRIMTRISNEYYEFVKAVINSYQERVNRFLKSASPELIAEIGYNYVVLDFQTKWELPQPVAKLKLEQLRNIRLDDDQECFFTSVVRRHYKKLPKDKYSPQDYSNSNIVWDGNNNPYEEVEEVRLWANMGYNFIDPETKSLAFESDKEIEISALASMVGFLAEKGIEYMEAERQTKNKTYTEQAKMEISKKIKDVDEVFKQAISKKEAEGNLSEKLILDKEES